MPRRESQESSIHAGWPTIGTSLVQCGYGRFPRTRRSDSRNHPTQRTPVMRQSVAWPRCSPSCNWLPSSDTATSSRFRCTTTRRCKSSPSTCAVRLNPRLNILHRPHELAARGAQSGREFLWVLRGVLLNGGDRQTQSDRQLFGVKYEFHWRASKRPPARRLGKSSTRKLTWQIARSSYITDRFLTNVNYGVVANQG